MKMKPFSDDYWLWFEVALQCDHQLNKNLAVEWVLLDYREESKFCYPQHLERPVLSCSLLPHLPGKRVDYALNTRKRVHSPVYILVLFQTLETLPSLMPSVISSTLIKIIMSRNRARNRMTQVQLNDEPLQVKIIIQIKQKCG